VISRFRPPLSSCVDLYRVLTDLTRHRASTSMYWLTFRVRVTTPRSMDEMERSRRVGVIAGEGSLRRHA